MESWFCWIHLVILFRNTWSSSSPPRYTVHQSPVSFDQAAESCSPGVLTTLATEPEVSDVLGLVSVSMPARRTESTFWVGLRKVKNECVVPTLPLRGFKWTEDASEDTQVSRWTEEPQHTCTSVRCAALKVEWDGSQVTRWGLIPISCKSSYQFICKLTDRGTGPPKPDVPEPPKPDAPEPPKPGAPETPKPGAPEPPKPGAPETPKPGAPEPPEPPKPAAPEPPKPDAPEPPKPAAPEPPKPGAPETPKPGAPEPPKHATPAKPERRPATQKPEAANPEPGLPSLESETGPELRGPDPDPDPCLHPVISRARSISFVNSSRIQVQCWSPDPDLVELHCSGRPAAWRLPDDSPADFTAVCRLCDSGFRKDVSRTCVDVDECSSAPCRFSCLNTVGSFRCFCSDDDEEHVDKNSPACAETMTTATASGGVLVPVLVSAAVLAVLLVVVVIVTVKCCLTRRSRNREKMKMKRSEDGGDSANETAA